MEFNLNTFDLLSSPFRPFTQVECIDKQFDFKISPIKLLNWLDKEVGEVNKKDYGYSVSKACEFSCLYTSMLLYRANLEGVLKVHYGSFGFWEHYWMSYKFQGQLYFIDPTLMQFLPNVPKIAVSLANDFKDVNGYNSLDLEGTSITNFIEKHKAFKFYTNPRNNKKPTIKQRFIPDSNMPKQFEFITL